MNQNIMVAKNDPECEHFIATLETWPSGYLTGCFDGERYGVSVDRPVGGRVTKVFAQELGGTEIVSFNLFWIKNAQPLLKPCEMSSDKVKRFVLLFVPDKQLT